MSTDPLSRVPGIWRACLAVELNGTRGRLARMNPGPGLNWNADVGVGYMAGVDRILAEAWGRAQLRPQILLDDPTGATTGCLAAFCRGLYKDPLAYAMPEGGRWTVYARRNVDDVREEGIASGLTEPAAWRAAILAHPSLSELR